MTISNRYIHVLFFVFAAIFTASTLVKPYPFSWVLKIIPLAILILYVAKSVRSKSHTIFLLGLVCSSLGDFFLDHDRETWFVFGLGAFLIAHVMYITAMLPLKKKSILGIMPYLIFGAVMYFLLAPNLAELFLPVVLYMTVLLLMGVVGFLSKESNGWLLIGGVSFILSDSMIGIDKFYSTIPNGHFWIMMTYYFAQYSLMRGILANNERSIFR